MRFAHRRAKDEGEFAVETGGFFASPPTTPPHISSQLNNDLGAVRGELGDFSLPLHVGGNIPASRRAFIHHPSRALATCAPTPPARPISWAKSPEKHENSKGGVFSETPPDALADLIDRVSDLPAEIIAGLRELRARPAPLITRPAIWAEVVNDAMTLAADGSARRALDLGWDMDDVFGVGVHSSDAFESLSVWLAGRKVDVVAEWKAVTTCGSVFLREAFGRPNSPRLPSVPLWQFGRAPHPATTRRIGHHRGTLT